MPPPTPPAPPPCATEPADLSNLLRGIHNNEELLRKLIANFLADTPHRLQELHRAWAARDGEGLGGAAHSLRGSLTVFGAGRATALARAVEQAAREHDWTAGEGLVADLEAEVGHLADFLSARSRGTP